MRQRIPSSRGSVLRVVLWSVAVLGLLGGIAFTGFNAWMRGKYEPTLAAIRKDVTENVDDFCAQQVTLSRDPWFHEPRTEGDAGPLLNAWIPWEPKRAMPEGSPLAIPQGLPQRPAGLGSDWLTASIDVSALDFGWMQRLRAYDRWDILKDSVLTPGERVDWAAGPIPDFVMLQLWVKFRLLHGLRTGQPLEAAKDVRHLAWLVYRTDTLIGGALATAMLGLERKAHDSMQAPPPEWQPMSQEQVDRMRAVVMSGFVFSGLVAPPAVGQKARHCGEPAVSRCIALSEAAFIARLLQPVAERPYREAYAALRDDLAATPCATSVPGALWARGSMITDPGQPSFTEEQVAWARSLPGALVGPHIAGMSLAAGAPALEPLRKFHADHPQAHAEP